ncbi:MAG TPA: hypothetical protein VIG88_05325 [Lysobacter sp.]
MTGWACPTCGAANDDGFDLCYACGTGRDGSPADPSFRREGDVPDPALRALDCLRCAAPMRFQGRRRFHEGSVAQAALPGELFTGRQALDAYACSRCGKVEFFVPGAAG